MGSGFSVQRSARLRANGASARSTVAREHSARAKVEVLVVLVLAFSVPAGAQVAETSCDAMLLAPRQVRGRSVGPKSCLMQETSGTYEGRAVTRVDVGLDGTVDGYLSKVGNYKEYFSNSPDLVFPQTWGPREIFFGVAAYER